MSEMHGEVATPVEKESGAVKKMAERVGTFLSETYTFKGAKAKELKQLNKVVGGFTESQQQEMRKYFEAKAEKSAKWKVIRNWVATGAGIALGTILVLKPALIVNALTAVGTTVSTWWQGLEASRNAAAVAQAQKDAVVAANQAELGRNISAGWNNGVDWLKNYVFDTSVSKPVVVSDLPGVKEVAGAGGQVGDVLSRAYTDTSTGLQEAYNKGIKPILLKVQEGPNWPVPKFSWK